MIPNEILTIKEDNESKIEVKKSVFIAHIFRVNSEEEAKDKINELKVKYKDATHNVPAYRVCDFEKEMIIERCSDDGEPSGTSGKPILDLLKHKNLLNVLIVVTRYFGGTLLGTGGLVKAYTDSAKLAVEAETVTLERKSLYKVKTNYELFNKIKKRFEDNDFKLDNIKYDLDINFDLYIKDNEADKDKLKLIADEYSDNIIINKLNTCYK